jgi:hypothetical protein
MFFASTNIVARMASGAKTVMECFPASYLATIWLPGLVLESVIWWDLIEATQPPFT